MLNSCNAKQYNFLSYFKPMNTLCQSLVRPKDKILKERVVGPVYHIPRDSCYASYIGKTEILLKARFWSINFKDPAPPPRKCQDIYI